MSDLTAFQNNLTDDQISAAASLPTDQALDAIQRGYSSNLQNNTNQGEATPSDNNQPVPTTPAEVGEQQAPIDYEAEYNKIMQPFQASGHEVHLRNTDEVISLMQKGVDYTKKQQALKPRLKEMRILENAGMLGDNLNYAIDLYNGDPKALKHLIETKKIDLSTLDTGSSVDENGNPIPSTYVPKDHSMSDQQYNLETIMKEVLNSPQKDEILNVIGSLDQASTDIFANHPEYFKALQTQIQNGVFKTIMDEVNHRKLVGDTSIDGKGWYDTYMTVGKDIYKQQQESLYRDYQQALQNQQQQQAQAYSQQQRKNAARPTRGSSPVQQQFDPLSMSDEEFSKLDVNQLFR